MSSHGFPHRPQDANHKPVSPWIEYGATITIGDEPVTVTDWLGCGAFGQVFEITDATGQKLAMKVERCDRRGQSGLEREVICYKRIEESFHDTELAHIPQIKHFKMNNGWAMMVLEKFEQSLLDLIDNARRQYRLGKVVSLGRCQMVLRSLAPLLISMKASRIIHTDIKPENLLFDSEMCVKMIDFGGALMDIDEGGLIGYYFQSRFYRAPEVVLEMNPSYPIDVWSLGCVIAEMWIYLPIFASEDALNHLQLIELRMGKFPIDMVRNSPRFEDFFDDYGNVRKPADGIVDMAKLRPESLRNLVKRRAVKHCRNEEVELDAFADLLEAMLAINPDERITPEDIRDHRFLQMNLTSPLDLM